VETLGEVPGATFFVPYTSWIFDVEAIGDVSEARFFVLYIGWTGHVRTIREATGENFKPRI
jgi:hypothetical protein